jgi:hypothetical protein
MMILMKTTNVRLFLVGLVATSWLFVLVTPQQEPGVWSGCIDPDKSKSQNLVRIQQPSRVCFSIANDTDWNSGFASYLRASFEPKADVYSRFHIPNCKHFSPCFVIFFLDTNPISIPHFLFVVAVVAAFLHPFHQPIVIWCSGRILRQVPTIYLRVVP